VSLTFTQLASSSRTLATFPAVCFNIYPSNPRDLCVSVPTSLTLLSDVTCFCAILLLVISVSLCPSCAHSHPLDYFPSLSCYASLCSLVYSRIHLSLVRPIFLILTHELFCTPCPRTQLSILYSPQFLLILLTLLTLTSTHMRCVPSLLCFLLDDTRILVQYTLYSQRDCELCSECHPLTQPSTLWYNTVRRRPHQTIVISHVTHS
jgi:hypothetical protein